MDTFHRLTRLEGVIPADGSRLDMSTVGRRRCPRTMFPLCLSGGGDKDMNTVANWRGDGPGAAP